MTTAGMDLIVHPLTGEQIDLSASDDQLAEWIDQASELERLLRNVKTAIGDELIGRMDRQAHWTLRTGRFKVTAPSPKPKVDWDVDQLQATLADFRDQGVIDEDAIDRAMKVKVTRVPQQAGLNALMKLGTELEERIRACAAEVPAVRRVKVEIDKLER